MKNTRWIKILTVGLIALMPVVGTVESAEKPKFKFADLFKKTKPANTKESDTKSSGETAEKGKETEAAKTPASAKTTKSTSSKTEELSTADQIRSLTKSQNLADTDPDALLRMAREKMRALKGKESSSSKTSSAKEKKTEPVAKAKEVPKPKEVTKPAPVAQPTKVVTAGVVPKSAKVADTSRPPSLAPVTAVATAAAVAKREAPPANLQMALAASGVPLPKPLVPQKMKKKKKTEGGGGLEITSDEAETDLAANTVTFIGNVELHEPTFNLQCDRLVVYMNDKEAESNSQFKEAVATGAMVVVERVNEKGVKDVGHSRKVVYDDRTGDIVLSGGPPVLQSGGRSVETESANATITLKKDGNHSVKDRGKFIIPVKNKAGEAKKGPNLLPTKMDDISNRKK